MSQDGGARRLWRAAGSLRVRQLPLAACLPLRQPGDVLRLQRQVQIPDLAAALAVASGGRAGNGPGELRDPAKGGGPAAARAELRAQRVSSRLGPAAPLGFGRAFPFVWSCGPRTGQGRRPGRSHLLPHMLLGTEGRRQRRRREVQSVISGPESWPFLWEYTANR